MILEWLGLGVTVFTQTAAENTGADDPGKKKPNATIENFFKQCCVPEERHCCFTDTESCMIL